MKNTGVVRKIDELGRIVIPKEIRRSFNINEGDSLEIFTEEGNIILKKYTPGCHCCDEMEGLTEVLGLKLCTSCILVFNKSRSLIDTLR